MTWAVKLIEKAGNRKKIIPDAWCKTPNEKDSYITGVDDGFKDLVDDLVLAVLEEDRFIIEKSKQIKNPTSRKKFIRQRRDRAFRELVQKCKELSEKSNSVKGDKNE